MNFHPHIHMILLSGGLTSDNRWKDNGVNFFLPVRIVSEVFRGKYLAELKMPGKMADWYFMVLPKNSITIIHSKNFWIPVMAGAGFPAAKKLSMVRSP